MPKLFETDLGKYPRRNAQTINKTLALLSGVLARVERDGYFETLPAWTNLFHVGFDIALAEREPYEPFTCCKTQETRPFGRPLASRLAALQNHGRCKTVSDS